MSLTGTTDNKQTGAMFHRKASCNGPRRIGTSSVVLTNTFESLHKLTSNDIFSNNTQSSTKSIHNIATAPICAFYILLKFNCYIVISRAVKRLIFLIVLIEALIF